MLPTLIFVRHGETNWNVEGRLQGQRDIPLNDKGRGQAKRNGETILSRVPGIAAYDFVASPLIRSRETMEIARLAMGLDPSAYRLDDRDGHQGLVPRVDRPSPRPSPWEGEGGGSASSPLEGEGGESAPSARER